MGVRVRVGVGVGGRWTGVEAAGGRAGGTATGGIIAVVTGWTRSFGRGRGL